MKQLLEHIKQELIARCKAYIQSDCNYFQTGIKDSALNHFQAGYECFTQLFDTEEEVLEWLEDEHLI
jgi:hypothetical protein